MSGNINPGSDFYLVKANGNICAMVANLPALGIAVKGYYRTHRIVVLPDYQGVGVGKAVLNFAAEEAKKKGKKYMILTSSRSMIEALRKAPEWLCWRYGKRRTAKNTHIPTLCKTQADKRISVTFEYTGLKA